MEVEGEMGTPVIGVTGSMGSGKTTFARFLASAGDGEHLDADEIAKRLMNPGRAGYEPVLEEFGTYITDEQGYIQPDKLADEVFGNPEKLSRLESILHPLVRQHMEETIKEARKSFYVLDVPLLFEAGMQELCDWTVTVVADVEKVVERMTERGFSRENIEQRRKRQMSEEEKIKRADEVVRNNGSLEELSQRAEQILERIHARDF